MNKNKLYKNVLVKLIYNTYIIIISKNRLKLFIMMLSYNKFILRILVFVKAWTYYYVLINEKLKCNIIVSRNFQSVHWKRKVITNIYNHGFLLRELNKYTCHECMCITLKSLMVFNIVYRYTHRFIILDINHLNTLLLLGPITSVDTQKFNFPLHESR